MEYIRIGIIVVAVIVVGIILYIKFKKKAVVAPDDVIVDEDVPVVKDDEKLDKIKRSDELVIQVEMLPVETFEDESKLVEITDSKVLAHINNLVPGLTQAGNAMNNAAQAAKSTNGEVLYRAIIPVGAKLTNSKNTEGAVRGFYHDTNGIKGHADFVAVEAQNGTTVVANTVAATMGVASMVVGQYYMTRINAELGVINNGISQIQDFQDNEYRSRVISLVAHVKKIADFQEEVLENNELRISKIAQLDSLEEECTQLLGQANLTLAGFAKRNELGYEEYEKALGNAQNWFIYQKFLLNVLYKISDLRYTLHLGVVSREQCVALLSTYTKQVNETQTHLTAWHNRTAKRLGIKIEKNRRKRVGFDGAVHFIPGMFNNDWNFRPIEKETASMITEQSSGHKTFYKADTSELYAEDVQLISKGGKIYYLPKNENEQ